MASDFLQKAIELEEKAAKKAQAKREEQQKQKMVKVETPQKTGASDFVNHMAREEEIRNFYQQQDRAKKLVANGRTYNPGGLNTQFKERQQAQQTEKPKRQRSEKEIKIEQEHNQRMIKLLEGAIAETDNSRALADTASNAQEYNKLAERRKTLTAQLGSQQQKKTQLQAELGMASRVQAEANRQAADFEEKSKAGPSKIYDTTAIDAAREKVNVLRGLMATAPGNQKSIYASQLALAMQDLGKLENAPRKADDKVYDFVNDINGFRETAKKQTGKGHYGEYQPLSFLTQDEIANYNYTYATRGKEAADDYLGAIMDDLRQREAKRIVENTDTQVGKTLFGAGAGIDQYMTSVKQLFSDEAVPTSAVQYASQEMSKDMGTVQRLAYDLLQTTANMAPSILLASFTGGIAAAAGLPQAAINAASVVPFGLSAKGSALNEKLKEGADPQKAQTYSTLVGIAEAGLQAAIGGISKLAGINTTKFAQKIAAMDNTFLRIAGQFGLSGAGEALEETAQTYIEPAINALIFNEKYEAPDVEEALYSGLMGFLSAGLLEGADIVIEDAQARKAGAEIKTIGKDAVQRMTEYGLSADKDSLQYRIAQRVQEKLKGNKEVTNYELGKMYGEAVKEMAIGQGLEFNAELESLRQTGGAEDEGSNILSDGAEWQAGQRAGEPDGGVGKSTVAGNSVDLRERANRARNITQDLRGQEKSTAEIGIKNGSEEKTMLFVPRERYNEEMQAVSDKVKRETGYDVEFFTGEMRLKANNAKGYTLVNAAIYGDNSIVVQADNAYWSIEQLSAHESMHAFLDAGVKGKDETSLFQFLRNKVAETYGEEQFYEIIKQYTNSLEGTTVQTVNGIIEEMICDAYAGMNAFGSGVTQYTETVRQGLEEFNAPKETETGTEQTRGPPTMTTEEVMQKTMDMVQFSWAEPAKIEDADEKKAVVAQLRKYMSGDMSLAELRGYINGAADARTEPAKTREAKPESSEANEIIRSARQRGMSVREYISENWDRYERNGRPNEAAMEAMKRERGRFSNTEENDDGRQTLDEGAMEDVDTSDARKSDRGRSGQRSGEVYGGSSGDAPYRQLTKRQKRKVDAAIDLYLDTGKYETKRFFADGDVSKTDFFERFFNDYTQHRILAERWSFLFYDGYINHLLNELDKITGIDTSGTLKFSITEPVTPEELDERYMEAVESGDIETAQEMVDEAAEAAGYSEKLYHGTTGFGFTKIDLNKSDDKISFFATDSLETAATYSGTNEPRHISDYEGGDDLESLEKAYYHNVAVLFDRINRASGIYNFVDYDDPTFNKIERNLYDGKDTLEGAVEELTEYVDELVYDLYFYMSHYDPELEQDTFYERPEIAAIYEVVNDLAFALKAIADFDEGSLGNYQLYANTDNFLELDAKGKKWSEIPFGEYDKNGFHPVVNTRQAARYAKAEGYSGVKISNVFDDGGRNIKYQSKPATVYIFFNPQAQVKSADTVTYDDNGNVIPLSERFNEQEKDIRFSNTEPVEEDKTVKLPSGENDADWNKPVRLAGGEQETAEKPMTTERLLEELTERPKTEETEPKTIKRPTREELERMRQRDLDYYWQTVEKAAEEFETRTNPEDKISLKAQKKQQTVKGRSFEAWDYFKRKMIDSGEAVARIGKAVNDKSLYHYYNMARASSNAATSMIMDGRTDIYGNSTGKSLNDVLDKVRKKGNDYYKKFQLYLYHMHNVDRMSRFSQENIDAAQAAFEEFKALNPELTKFADYQLEQMARDDYSPYHFEAEEYIALRDEMRKAENTRNKPIFGFDVSASDSKAITENLLRENNSFLEEAKEVYDYIDNLLRYRVDSGLITEEDYAKLKSIYPHYVPTFRVFEEDNVDTRRKNRVQIGSTIKRASGSSEKLMPLHKALAQQTMSVVREGSKNRFGQRLLNSKAEKKAPQDVRNISEYMGEFSEVTFDQPEDEGLKKNNTFIVREGGKQWQIEMSPSLFEAITALSPPSQENNVAVKVIRAGNDLFKKLVTGANPVFLARNFMRDLQDAGIYSKDLSEFVKQYPQAVAEIAKNGKYWQRYKALGGTYSSVFDYEMGEVRGSKLQHKTVGRIEALNMAVEQAPRLAEFMATVKKAEKAHGKATMEDLMEAMYNAADITVNFGRSGTLGKYLNANFVPFLNPGIQGFSKMIRNVTETKGAKNWARLVIKAAALGIAPTILNALLYRDDDEWDKLKDRDKDIYYLFKLSDNMWLKLPKGRTLSLLGMAADRAIDAAKGEKVNWAETANTALSQSAPANPLENNILQAGFDTKLFKPENPGETWYGTDIESQRLQGYAPEDRYDATTDKVSKWLGKTFKLSPKKINYLLDQYTGVVGDILLPLLTPTAERDMFSAAFTLDSVYSNKYNGEFYDMQNELEYKKNSANATGADDVIFRYWNKQTSAVSDINKSIREIEADESLSDKDKKELVRAQYAIRNAVMEEALKNYDAYEKAAKDFYKESELTDEEERIEEAYRKANEKVFGAEYALRAYNKTVYATANQMNTDSNISYKDFYDFYFDTKDNAKVSEQLSAIKGSDMTEADKKAFVSMVVGTPVKDENGQLTGEYELKTKAGKDTAYAKMLKALDSGLSVDDYIELREKEVDIDAYLKKTDKGMSATGAMKIVLARGDEEPEEGKEQLTQAQEFKIILDSGISDKDQKIALKDKLGDGAYKVDVAESYDISAKEFMDFKIILPEYDKDGNGTYKHAEIEAAVKAMPGLSNKERATLWQLQVGTGSKNNPFDRSVGSKIIAALKENKK